MDSMMVRRNRIKLKIWLVALVLLTISVSILAGCKNYEVVNNNSEYNTFIMKDGIAKFSFEYNAKYELKNVNELKTGTNIYVYGPSIGQTWYFTLIAIHVIQPENGHIDYKYYLERSIEIDSGKRDFVLVDRIPINLSGESGEGVSIRYTAYPLNEGLMQGIPPAPFLVRRVMIWHKDLLWWLEIGGLESTSETDKADFEHMLQTFKIFD